MNELPCKLINASLVRAHITSLYVMPEVSPLTTCGDMLNRASRAVLDSVSSTE